VRPLYCRHDGWSTVLHTLCRTLALSRGPLKRTPPGVFTLGGPNATRLIQRDLTGAPSTPLANPCNADCIHGRMAAGPPSASVELLPTTAGRRVVSALSACSRGQLVLCLFSARIDLLVLRSIERMAANDISHQRPMVACMLHFHSAGGWTDRQAAAAASVADAASRPSNHLCSEPTNGPLYIYIYIYICIHESSARWRPTGDDADD